MRAVQLSLICRIPWLVIVVVVIIGLPGFSHGLMVSSGVGLVSGVRGRSKTTGVLRNIQDACRVWGQRRRCWEVGAWSIVVRVLKTVGLQDVSAHPRRQSLMVRPTMHWVMRVWGCVVVQVTLTRMRVVVVVGIHFASVTMLMTLTILMGNVGLVTVAVVKAGLVFMTLIVVLMVSCVLVMD